MKTFPIIGESLKHSSVSIEGIPSHRYLTRCACREIVDSEPSREEFDITTDGEITLRSNVLRRNVTYVYEAAET